MAKIETSESQVCILLETQEDVWFWDRRFNLFDCLEFFPSDAISGPTQDGVTPIAKLSLRFETDAGFDFSSDIVRDGYFLRNQSHGTRKWMNEMKPGPGDSIVITKIDETHYRLTKMSGS